MTAVAGPFDGNAAAAHTAGNLCLDCGLCCDSGLFIFVELDADDVGRLNAIGVTAPEQIVQPCPFFDGCCTVYSHRPAKCVKYRCKVLKDLEGGEISFQAAREKVAQALAYREALLAQLPPGMTPNTMIEQWREEGERTGASAMTQARLAFVVFRSFVDRHFVRTKQRRITAEAVNPR